ncbi:MAG: glycosyltransferase family 2 protein [Bryobacteraceae bacterium]
MQSVSISIVTYNSARFIRPCLEYAFQQDYPRLDVIVIDNASTDETRNILREFENRIRVEYNDKNLGFAAAQNQGIALSSADWVLTLNPDVRLTPHFISTLGRAGEADSSVGSVCGKLLAMTPEFEISANPVLDSTGIYFTPSLRHFDRGSQEVDQGRYDKSEYVFGATGAAALYRRKMIQEISTFGEFFDSEFFAYREDADVAWRAQLMGWKCLYTPAAIAYHVRAVRPSNRRSLPPVVNMHSVKNRFLLRLKNATADLYLRNFFFITVRDLMVIGACLTRELTSLRAFPLVLRNLRRTWVKRRDIMARRRATDRYIRAWFSFTPVSYPAEVTSMASLRQEAATQ